MEYAEIMPLLVLVHQNPAALVLLWVYVPESREEHVLMWSEIARYENWAREEMKELLDYLCTRNELDSSSADTLELLYKVSGLPDLPSRREWEVMRRNTLWYLIVETLKKTKKKRAEAISFLEEFLPGVDEPRIADGLKTVRKVLSGRHLKKLQEMKPTTSHDRRRRV